jgi:hypothetical protein
MICVPHAQTQMCGERRAALRRGELFALYDPKVSGWALRPEHYRPGDDVLILSHCLYCGGELPRLKGWPNTDAAWLRILRAIWSEDAE